MADAKTVGGGDGQAAVDQGASDSLASLTTFTTQTAVEFGERLNKATRDGEGALKALLPLEEITKILNQASVLLKLEPTLVELKPNEGTRVTVVGDTHGQLHDVLHMLELAGYPSETSHFVFNGDFIDRGAWGLEVLLVFLSWKIACPKSVTLLRGNHETTTCSSMYGFKGEVELKYGKPQGKAVYDLCKRLFACLPLSARVGQHTLVLHGGLFRRPPPNSSSKNKRKRKLISKECLVGSLQDLRGSGKGGMDPNGRGNTVVATDVLWSDPVAVPGLHLNVSRGVGVVFGPDITQAFLEDNELKLILRSHEGPDARFERDDMANMQEGWTTDHDVAAGKLLTVFSAPDYPQFQADDENRYMNTAAVAVLRGPDWCSPQMVQYTAKPRPTATASYDYMDIPGSDEEIDIAGSDNSMASSISSLSDLEDSAFHMGGDLEVAADGRDGDAQGQAVPEKLDARKLRRQSREDKAGSFAVMETATAVAAVPPSEQDEGVAAGTALPLPEQQTEAAAAGQAAATDTIPLHTAPPADPMDIDPFESQNPPPDPNPSTAPPLDTSADPIPAALEPPQAMLLGCDGVEQGGVESDLASPMETDASQPGINPSQPGANPSQPGTDPSQPGANPSQPGANPSQPGTITSPQKSAAPEAGTSKAGAPTVWADRGPLRRGEQTPLSDSNGVGGSSLEEAVTPLAQPISAPPQMHTGRELEQAAAHALAVDGGVGQDTPETGPLYTSHGVSTPREELFGDTPGVSPDAEMASQDADEGQQEAVKKPAKTGGALPQSRLANGSKAPAPWR